MTAANRSADAPTSWNAKWKSIDWKTVRESVKRLQVRIAKAVTEGKFRKAKALQWLLTHSYHAKLLAVKRVTSNKGRRTAGVDGIIWKTPRQKLEAVKLLRRRGYRPLPLRRIYIPKKNKLKKRPLSIPVMIDRAFQALYKLALEPVAEVMADRNSYGFRQKRRCADAVAQCFITLAKGYSPVWILEADIKACFDEICHQWMLDNILIDKTILNKWLKAGYIESGKCFPTHKGTPQGGIISPILMNMTLDGLEAAVRKAVPDRITRNTRSKVNFIRYADDFIVTGATREILEEQVKPVIESFLQQRGLKLSEEKTSIVQIEEGFNFLGQNIRKYDGKLLIKPSKESVQSFLEDIRSTIRKHRGSSTVAMIGQLNPKIRGWANYHRHVVSGKAFSHVDSSIYNNLWQWMKRRHRNKSKTWMKKKYWFSGSRPWIFSGTCKDRNGTPRLYELVKASSTSIIRHIKIRGDANPFDPKYDKYFRKRRVCSTYGHKECLV
jgi:RNA-directed DNA polymerase